MDAPAPRPRAANNRPLKSAFYLTEIFGDINSGAGFLDRLAADDIRRVRAAAVPIVLEPGSPAFTQGDRHEGIYLIESGRIRTYYAGFSGREITLAYWTPGHFVGGPDIFGGGQHMWSGMAIEPTRLSFLSGAALKRLAETIPTFALCLIDGLVAKGRCYSALIQILGTRSVTERLAQLLLILAEIDRIDGSNDLIIQRTITHEQFANFVGSTRQWVTRTLSNFESRGLISVERDAIRILSAAGLRSACS